MLLEDVSSSAGHRCCACAPNKPGVILILRMVVRLIQGRVIDNLTCNKGRYGSIEIGRYTFDSFSSQEIACTLDRSSKHSSQGFATRSFDRLNSVASQNRVEKIKNVYMTMWLIDISRNFGLREQRVPMKSNVGRPIAGAVGAITFGPVDGSTQILKPIIHFLRYRDKLFTNQI